MITFEKWEQPRDFACYSVKLEHYYIGRIILDKRPDYNNVMILDERKLYSMDLLNKIAEAIKTEFGDIEFAVMSS